MTDKKKIKINVEVALSRNFQKHSVGLQEVIEYTDQDELDTIIKYKQAFLRGLCNSALDVDAGPSK